MMRARITGVVGFILFAAGAFGLLNNHVTAAAPNLQWIWYNDGDPAKSAPAEARYFRKTFEVSKAVNEAVLEITADDSFKVWLNGQPIGSGHTWSRVYTFNVNKYFVQGTNVLAVEALNQTVGPAGLLVRLSYVPNGNTKMTLVSDASWRSSKTGPAGWQKVDFDDRKWPAAKLIGTYGQAGPWQGLVWNKDNTEEFTVPPGFKVELAALNPDPIDVFSLVNLTFDNRGRLLVSQENGPVLLCTKPNKSGIFEQVKPYCKQVKNCQGMCWVDDALLLIGDGPQGTGLYRVRDTKKVDQTDEVQLLQKIVGGMGEHGPHAIVHGPDGWLYLVIGNHAWAKPEQLAANSPLQRWPNGQPGPDQSKPNTTEDVLLPRLNDARGHAANILAPGGTIWRLDKEGKNMSLVAAGFRNHFDAAFSPSGELFTFDSDMEWDEALPWYRAVRVCHCPPGADFLWRTGAANTPDYYVDSLPPLLETGRGSPVGVEFYDHHVFPERYRGAFFMADWSLGLIYAVHLKRDGATYQGTTERFCTGKPMNVTDLAVGPDGAMYFTMGGRGTRGGVYRIVYSNDSSSPPSANVQNDQPLAAWSRPAFAGALRRDVKSTRATTALLAIARDGNRNEKDRLRALTLLESQGAVFDPGTLQAIVKDKSPEIRAQSIAILSHSALKAESESLTLINALADQDALVRRRACEALIRRGIEPPVEAIWPLLSDKDRFVRTAARLVLQRIDLARWSERLWKEPNDGTFLEGVVALCKTNQAAPLAAAIFERLNKVNATASSSAMLDFLRVFQLALIHTKTRPDLVPTIAMRCMTAFPQSDPRINRELAIVLAHCRTSGLLGQPVHHKLLSALIAAKVDKPQQIHFFYCLRLLSSEPWTPEQKQTLANWYDATKSWQGGLSFTPFLENIFRELLDAYTVSERREMLKKAEQQPLVALVLAQRLQTDRQQDLLKDLENLSQRIGSFYKPFRGVDLPQAVSTAILRTALQNPSAENWQHLVRGLDTTNSLLLFDLIETLKKLPSKPKADDPAPYRLLLTASDRLDERSRWHAVDLLRHWTNGKQFGAEDRDWKAELPAWKKWFAQTFPQEPAFAGTTDQAPVSKYQFAELLALLESPSGRQGNVARGRIVFEKAQCFKCHKYGKEGEGIGPDLTTLSKRFKRSDTLDAMFYPSKVISDQYRSTTIVTKKGQQLSGLMAVQGDGIVVLQSDGAKLSLKKEDVAQQFASLVSVMPEKLLDTLSKDEIIDLFQFLESEPAK